MSYIIIKRQQKHCLKTPKTQFSPEWVFKALWIGMSAQQKDDRSLPLEWGDGSSSTCKKESEKS